MSKQLIFLIFALFTTSTLTSVVQPIEFLSLKASTGGEGGSSGAGSSTNKPGTSDKSSVRPGRKDATIQKGDRTNTRMRAAMVWGMIMNNAHDQELKEQEPDLSYKQVLNECFINNNEVCVHCCIKGEYGPICGAYSDCNDVGILGTILSYFVWAVLLAIWISLCVCPKKKKLDLSKDDKYKRQK